MTPKQKNDLRLSEVRRRLAELGGMAELTDEHRAEIGTLRTEYGDLELRAQALTVAGGDPEPTETTKADGELQELRAAADFGGYVQAALAGHGVVSGPHKELNTELGIADNYFPLEALEHRAAIAGDSKANQGTWLDRIFANAAAMRLGVTFSSVAPGVASFPITTAGGSGAQRGRTEAVAASTYTVTVSDLKPTRQAVHGVYSIEDEARLPGLADAISRDMRLGLSESVDKAIFVGDAGANEDVADITGLTTVQGIGEKTLTQANKLKADLTLQAFAGWVDGVLATSLEGLRIVTTVGANVLWQSTIHNSVTANQTIAQFLRESGLSWVTRGSIESATANGDFGAFVGLPNGIEGSARAAIWDAGQLIRDNFTGAKSGEVQLTLNYLWAFAVLRTNNFKRLKFVT